MISELIPKIINNSEAILSLNEQSHQTDQFLEKAFGVMYYCVNGPSRTKEKFVSAQVLQPIVSIIQETLIDTNKLSLLIIKRFIRLLQLATSVPSTYDILEEQNIMKILVEIVQNFLSDQDQELEKI
mmetsp:Transcript_20028/g.19010  ORF Transcript_20028/g.19010 Transcript_20028/m.19010 type:complete len:127 (-) Transcript_20028:19-399(-)